MLRPPASQRAFTLVEVLMAATVMVVSFTAVIQAVTLGADMIDTARKQQVAQQIIEGEIAYQRTSPWSQTGSVYGINDMLDSTFRIRVNDSGISAADDTSANGYNDLLRFGLDNNPELLAVAKGFTCEAGTINLRPPPQPPLLLVTFTVTWTNRNTRTLSRKGNVLFAENGLRLSYQK